MFSDELLVNEAAFSEVLQESTVVYERVGEGRDLYYGVGGCGAFGVWSVYDDESECFRLRTLPHHHHFQTIRHPPRPLCLSLHAHQTAPLRETLRLRIRVRWRCNSFLLSIR